MYLQSFLMKTQNEQRMTYLFGNSLYFWGNSAWFLLELKKNQVTLVSQSALEDITEASQPAQWIKHRSRLHGPFLKGFAATTVACSPLHFPLRNPRCVITEWHCWVTDQHADILATGPLKALMLIDTWNTCCLANSSNFPGLIQYRAQSKHLKSS